MAGIEKTALLSGIGGSTGAALGSIFPGVGTAIGTGVGTAAGATAGGIWDFINWLQGRNQQQGQTGQPGETYNPELVSPGSNPGGFGQLSLYNKPQQQLQNASIMKALELLKGGSPAGFEGIENQARGNFASKTVPLLAERFAGRGNESGSSALTGQLSGAGAELERGLASLRGQLSNQQLSSLLGNTLRPSVLSYQGQQEPGVSDQLIEMLPNLLNLYSQYQKANPQDPQQAPGQSYLDQQGVKSFNALNDVYRPGVNKMPGMPGWESQMQQLLGGSR